MIFKTLGKLWDIFPYHLKYPLLLGLRLLRPPKVVTRHLHFSGPFTTSFHGAVVKIWSMPTIIENEIFWYGLDRAYEPMSLRVWAALAENVETGNLLDIGANTGIFSVVAHSVNRRCKIYCFDPGIEFCNSLERTKNLNSMNMIINPFALGSGDGLIGYDGYQVHEQLGCHQPVPVKRLSSYWRENNLSGPIAVKMDIEGFEPAVLRDILAELDEFRPAMLVEILSKEAAREILQVLNGLSYAIYSIHDEELVIKLVEGEEILLGSGGRNFLFLQLNQVPWFRERFRAHLQ